MDEIPEAIRVRKSINQQKRSPRTIITGGVLCLALVGLLSVFLASSFTDRPQPTAEKSSKAVNKIDSEFDDSPVPTTLEAPKSPPVSPTTAIPKKEDLLGHLPYEEISESKLETITADGSVRLHFKAAAKFREMQAAARAEGIILTPISGFRSTETQESLFFEIKEERLQNATKRAEVSAPPGYSEHHTGYAIDIGDGKVPQANVEAEFENTEAFRWLQQNAARFSFELSFPPNNAQGVSYEPWHWRYVGDRHSLETFYKVRNSN